MSKQMNIRMDEVHVALLEAVVKEIGTNKTDVIQKALYSYAKDVIGFEEVGKIIDKYYTGIHKDLDE